MSEKPPVKDPKRDAYIFEIQHMDRKNPFWLATVISSLIALIAFAYELFSMNNGNNFMTWTFAILLIISLICLWFFQQRYKKWEIQQPNSADPTS